MRAEDWKDFNGFERNTNGLGEIVLGRRGVEDRYENLEYKVCIVFIKTIQIIISFSYAGGPRTPKCISRVIKCDQ